MSDRRISQTAKDLMQAMAIIQDEANWCQGQYFSGNKACAFGAVMNLDLEGNAHFAALLALNQAAQHFGFRHASDLNDRSDHKAVMDMFSRAIDAEIAKGDGK